MKYKIYLFLINKQIDSLLAKKKMPVVVGGTNYYIESLLWKVLVPEQKCDSAPKKVLPEEYMQLSNLEIYEKLKEFDPERAKKLHPNDRRKVLR